MMEPNTAWSAALSFLSPTPIPLQTNELKQAQRGQTNTHTQTGVKQRNQASTNEQQETSTKQERTSTKRTNNHEWKPNERVRVNGGINEHKQTRTKPEWARTTQVIEKGGTREDEHGGRSGSSRSGAGAGARTAAAGREHWEQQEREHQQLQGWHLQQEQGYYVLPPSFFCFSFNLI